jgi:signal peptidase I
MSSFKKSVAREYFESLVIAVILALFIRTFVVQAFKIPTGSMEPNLLIGDHLLVNKFVFGPSRTALERMVLPIDEIRRGDVIVFKYPEEPERDFIKRVIGLPHDTIEVRAKRVWINGQRIDEPFVYYLEPPPPEDSEAARESSTGPERYYDTAGDLRERYGPVTVPADHYFVMGDNRDNSQDSRYWGFLPHANIKGRALVIYWSYDADSAGVDGPLSILTSFFTRTKWNRILHQVR